MLLHVFACILMFLDGMAHLSSVDGRFPALWVPLGAVHLVDGVDLRKESRWGPPQLDLMDDRVTLDLIVPFSIYIYRKKVQ